MKKSGFSLVELVLVLIILSLGLMSVLLVLRYAVTQSIDAHIYTVTNWLCQERIEDYLAKRRNNGFASLIPGTFTENPVSGFPGYERSTKISYVDIGDLNASVLGPTKYKKIEVTVTNSKAPGGITVSSVVSDY